MDQKVITKKIRKNYEFILPFRLKINALFGANPIQFFEFFRNISY